MSLLDGGVGGNSGALDRGVKEVDGSEGAFTGVDGISSPACEPAVLKGVLTLDVRRWKREGTFGGVVAMPLSLVRDAGGAFIGVTTLGG